MVKAIIFDLDDTLLKTRQTKYEAIQFAGKHFYNLDIATETIDAHWGEPFVEFIGNVFGHAEDSEQMATHYKSIANGFPNQPYEDAIAVVQELQQHYKLGILSSASKTLVINDLMAAGFRLSTFTFVQGSEDTAVHKPNPEVFEPILTAFKAHGIETSEIIYCGDRVDDYYAAHGAGLQFVGLANRTIPEETFTSLGALTVPTLTAVVTHIEQIGK